MQVYLAVQGMQLPEEPGQSLLYILGLAGQSATVPLKSHPELPPPLPQIYFIILHDRLRSKMIPIQNHQTARQYANATF